MSERFTPVPPQYRFLYKPVDNCESGGCHLDAWLPTQPADGGKGCPLAVMIHGGAFCLGSSISVPFNQVNYFLDSGFAVLSLEYRLAPHVTHYDIMEDILDAYKYIQARLNDEIKKVAGGSFVPNIDTTNCIASGGSAGGTASLFLAIDIESHNKTADQSLPQLKAIIPYYPLVDANKHFNAPKSVFEEFGKTEPEVLVQAKKVYDKNVSCAFTITPDMRPQQPLTIPRNLWARVALTTQSLHSFLYAQDAPFPPEASVIENLSSTFPPTFILAAMSDTLIPVEQSFQLEEKLKELGVEVRLNGGEGAFHGFVDASPMMWPQGNEWWEKVILPPLEWAKEKIERQELETDSWSCHS